MLLGAFRLGERSPQPPILKGSTMNQTVRSYLSSTDLRALAYAYSGNCWESWKAKKTKDLNSRDNPFLGGPSYLLDQGIAEIEGSDGKMIKVTPLTRIRVKQLSDASLERLGIAQFKNMGGNDVIHQEYVETFEENVANDVKHLMNNFLAAAAVIDGITSYMVSPDDSVDSLVAYVEQGLAGNSEIGTELGLMSRAAWIGRACMDGSWKDSADFVFAHTLRGNTSDIDPYVVQPVLNLFLADLKKSQQS